MLNSVENKYNWLTKLLWNRGYLCELESFIIDVWQGPKFVSARYFFFFWKISKNISDIFLFSKAPGLKPAHLTVVFNGKRFSKLPQTLFFWSCLVICGFDLRKSSSSATTLLCKFKYSVMSINGSFLNSTMSSKFYIRLRLLLHFLWGEYLETLR